MDVSWVCPIPGADPATVAWHVALMLGLAGFVVVGGAIFMILALIAYRRPPIEPGSPVAAGALTLARTAD